jgi:hypothetical protein
MHRTTRVVVGVVLLSWGFLAYQAARVPVLTLRITRMEQDAARLDSLQVTIRDLQSRYEQLQSMLIQRGAAGQPTVRPR